MVNLREINFSFVFMRYNEIFIFMRRFIFFTCLFILFVSQTNAQLPTLKKVDGRTQFIVDGKPFFALAGELHNSSTGSIQNMETIWPRMAEKNLNTVIAAMSWELLEPTEGQFDYSILDAMVQGAEKNHLKLVILWFGSWKNGNSTYVPAWVKTDKKRFPLVKNKNGNELNILSTFSVNACKADSNAFAHLMAHLRETDRNHTVIAIQIENEIGTMDMASTYMNMPNGIMRDFSSPANKAFAGQVPSDLISYLKKNQKTLNPVIAETWSSNGKKEKGTWEEVFGVSKEDTTSNFNEHFSYLTDEIFNTWNYATYVQQVAAAGKKEYNIPMYVNAWMKQPSQRDPGLYPSGGPQAHLIDIWRAGAPAIDFLAPDIYEISIFDKICQDYKQSDNPLFIPETRVDAAAAARALYTFGKYGALCYAPFGIDGGGFTNSAAPNEEYFRMVYGALKRLMPYLQQYAGTDKCIGLYLDDKKTTDSQKLGDYNVVARRIMLGSAQALLGTSGEEQKQENLASGAIIFQVAENEFIVAAGVGSISISISKPGVNGYISVDEIRQDKDDKTYYHRLNGDETAFGGATVSNGEVKIFRIRM